MRIGIALLTLAMSLQAHAADGDWVESARELRSETPAVRAAAIERLRAIPDLTATLRRELEGPNRLQVLATAEALELHELVPDLLKVGARDNEGYVYGTVNLLITDANRKSVEAAYLGRLRELDPRSGAGAKIILLTGLSRMSTSVSPELLERLAGDKNSQVRITAIRHAGRMASVSGDAKYLQLLRRASTLDPYQIRLNALYAVSELSPKLAAAAGVDYAKCRGDSVVDVREACALAEKRASGK